MEEDSSFKKGKKCSEITVFYFIKLIEFEYQKKQYYLNIYKL